MFTFGASQLGAPSASHVFDTVVFVQEGRVGRTQPSVFIFWFIRGFELKNDKAPAFDAKCDEVISSMSAKPVDTILETETREVRRAQVRHASLQTRNNIPERAFMNMSR